ncbi:MAG: glycogen debranching protein GlgX [Candidatus Nanopelagicaceae bacterium]
MKPASSLRLGAHFIDGGVDFALWAPAADSVEVALIDGDGRETKFALAHREGPIWHGHLSGVKVGQRYGYRVYGPWRPEQGWRFNPKKLLIDPYTHLLHGELQLGPEIYGHSAIDHLGDGDLTIQDQRDSLSFVPLSVVTDHAPRVIHRPQVPWNQTIIYEAHLRALTLNNPEIPVEERGTYKALGHSSTIAHLKHLGVTAIELMPIQHFLTEPTLRARGRENFWGYNPIAFSAPHRNYASTEDPITELQHAVDTLHENGIEVLLDLVYNHTAEGGKDGPTLSFRGIDNKTFYRHQVDDHYEDYTGCGNTVDTRRPFVTRMIIDSLHWWSEVIGVDGFRFDLTTALARGRNEIDTHGPLIAAIAADPILRERKVIAEPWDTAGYALGEFPYPWREWNDHYRDSVRQFWLGNPARGFSEGVADFARRLSGSHDIFYFRGPTSSINFITAHDGFTLHDLVTFQEKRNFQNGEENRDGSDQNRSWNLGIEGEVRDERINELRHRLKKSLLATLMLSSGVPMISMGDEVSRTQSGSNNAYSFDPNQPIDSEKNFFGGQLLDWSPPVTARDITDSLASLIKIRKRFVVERISDFFTGNLDLGTKRKDVAWFRRNGHEMDEENWHQGDRRYLALFIESSAEEGLLLFLNGDVVDHQFTLPDERWGDSYRSLFDSSVADEHFSPEIKRPGDHSIVLAHGAQVWLVKKT